MTAEQLRVFRDNSLADGARLIALFLLERQIGEWHEIEQNEFARLLNGYPSGDTIRRYVRQLELAGIVETKPGGRGHARLYRIAPHESGPKEIGPQESGVIPIKVRTDAELNEIGPQECGAKPIDPHGCGPKDIGPHQCGAKSSRAIEEEDRQEIEEYPPVVPPYEAAIEQHGAVLVGFRDALRDYLQKRVPPDRQVAYVHTVAAWMRDQHPGIWQLPNGGWLPHDKRPGFMASALNELAASDERSMKRPVGEPGNLATKLEILIKQWARKNEPRIGTDDRRAAGNSRSETRSDQASRRRASFGG